jgi:hypothetical protein
MSDQCRAQEANSVRTELLTHARPQWGVFCHHDHSAIDCRDAFTRDTRRPRLDEVRTMAYRGLWVIFACVALALLSFLFLPQRYASYAVGGSILGAWIGGVIYARDYYRHIKQFERDRDEFNRRLRER